MNKDEYFLKEALKEAKKAYLKNEVPVGCVIAVDDKIIARAHNQKKKKENPLCHAEMLAISKATKRLGTWILDKATIYVTLEPCIMCAGAIIQARIKRLVYGALEPKFGCAESLGNVFEDYKFNHKVIVEKGIMTEECSQLLKDFFKKIRNEKKVNKS